MIFSFCLYLSAFSICTFVSGIDTYLSLAGGFTSILYCFIFPILLYTMTNGLGQKHIKNIIYNFFMVLISLIGVIGGIFSVVNKMRPYDE